MVRPPRNDKPAIKKGAWSSEEDKKLMAYISKYGIWNWSQMPKFAGLSRSGKSCRLRWMNYLRPDVKLGNFTEEEDDIIMNMHEKLGSRWSAIAKQLPGRTDNEIKNHWHSRLKKRLQVNNTDSMNPSSKRKADEMSITCEDAIQENSHGSNATDPPNGASQNSELEGLCHIQNSPNLAVSVSSSNGEGDFGVDIGSSTRLNTSSSEMIEDYDEIFWSEPIFMENLSLEEQQQGYLQSQFDPILWSPGPMNPTSSFINDIYNDSILYSALEKEDMFYVGEPIFQF